MFDIRDHGGIFGAGKYRKGSKVPVSDTKEKSPIITLYNQSFQSSLLADAIGEDNSNYYYIFYDGQYKLLILNKIDGTYKVSASMGSSSTRLFSICSNNDGYVYVFADSYIKKVNVSDGSLIWSVNTNYQAMSKNIKMYTDGNYVYVIFSNSSDYTIFSKVSVSGSLVSSSPLSGLTASTAYFLDGRTLYFISNSTNLYKYDITTGNRLSISSVSTSFASGVADCINEISYKYVSPDVVAIGKDGTQLWSYATKGGGAYPTALIPMKDGMYLDDYFGQDVKLSINGTVLYHNNQPFTGGFSGIFHEYGKPYFLGNTYSYNGSSGYNTPTKVSEIVTLGG